MKKPKSKYTKEMIQGMLLTNPKALARGIVAIYKRQTPSEQAIGVTKEDNGKGFTGGGRLHPVELRRAASTWLAA